jgi:hypothetical protein
MPVRRSEKSPGRVQPLIDHHSTVARWVVAILVQKRFFAERVEFPCRGSHSLWGRNLSHSHRWSIICEPGSLPVCPEDGDILNLAGGSSAVRAARIGDEAPRRALAASGPPLRPAEWRSGDINARFEPSSNLPLVFVESAALDDPAKATNRLLAAPAASG